MSKDVPEIGPVHEVPVFLEYNERIKFERLLNKTRERAKEYADKIAKGVNDLNERLKEIADNSLKLTDDDKKVLLNARKPMLRRELSKKLVEIRKNTILVGNDIERTNVDLNRLSYRSVNVKIPPYEHILIKGEIEQAKEHIMKQKLNLQYLETVEFELTQAMTAFEYVRRRDRMTPVRAEIDDLLREVHTIQMQSESLAGLSKDELDELEAEAEALSKITKVGEL